MRQRWKWGALGVLAAVALAGCGSDAGSAGGAGTASDGWGSISLTSDTAGGTDTGGGWGGGNGAASDASASDTTGGDTGGWGGMADATSADAGGGWWADDAGAGGAGAESDADAVAAQDAAGADAADGADAEEPQTWQQQEKAPPLAQVSLGGGQSLDLVDMRVVVKVEGMRARVLVDHIFYNPHPKTLEGTFRYTLPAESSVSYFAMFPGISGTQPQLFGEGGGMLDEAAGALAETSPAQQVGKIDAKQWGVPKTAKIKRLVQATQAYEAEVAKGIDPALIEQVAPNTYSAKVFPLMGKGYQRILLAYEQTLPTVFAALPGASTETGRLHELVFALPEGDLGHADFTLLGKQTWIAAAKQIGAVSGVQESTSAAGYLARWESKGPLAFPTPADGKLVFRFAPAQGSDAADVLAGTDPELGHKVAVVRVRPTLPAAAQAPGQGAKQAVFLLDTSRSAHPLRFGMAMALMDAILAASPGIEGFGVIAFDSGASWIGTGSKPGVPLTPSGWIANDAAGRAAAKAAFDGLLLEGGSDLGAALRTLADPPTGLLPSGAGPDAKAPLDVFLLSDGALTWGERMPQALLARFSLDSPWQARFFAYRFGVGAENSDLFAQLTAGGGAVFECLSSAALPTCAKAHQAAGMRLVAAKVVADGPDGQGAAIDDVLVAGGVQTLYPGSSVLLAGPLLGSGKAKVVLEGALASGEKASVEVPVVLQPGGELAPRAWAEIAVAQLVGTGKKALEGLALALAQHYRVANPLSAFLLLEDQAAWEKYDFGAESTKLAGQTIATVIAKAKKLGEAAFSTWARLQQTLAEHAAAFGLKDVGAESWVAGLLAVGSDKLELLPPQLPWSGVPAKAIGPGYAAALQSTDFALVEPFTAEAESRLDAADVAGAVRALSTLMERAPGDDGLARLIGYRIAGWGETSIAAELFFAVLLRRPFEPQSWRDFAVAVAQSRPALALLGFEIALRGTWPGQFKGMNVVAKEEYAAFAFDLLAANPNHPLAPVLKERLAEHKLTEPPGEMRVTVTWNTNQTDIDLHVTAPSGEVCMYSHKKLSDGSGELYADLTGGYGPERFVAYKLLKGTYKVEVKFFAAPSQKLAPETWVQVRIWRKNGKVPLVTQSQVVLKNKGDKVLVATIEVP